MESAAAANLFPPTREGVDGAVERLNGFPLGGEGAVDPPGEDPPREDLPPTYVPEKGISGGDPGFGPYEYS